MIDLGIVKPGSTIRIPFGSYSGSTGASAAASNFAVGDILIYKDGNTTARASTSGFTATTSFSSVTGINVAIIDLADNSTADFYAAGSEYFVVISPFTVDTQTMAYVAARFVIGLPGAILATTIATLSSQTSFTLTSGPAEDDALNGCVVYIHDAASAVQGGFAVVLDYTGSTKTVTLTAGTTFTAAAKDNIMFLPPGNTQWLGATAQTGRDIGASVLLSNGTGTGQLKLASGYVAMTWADIASPTTTVNFSGSTIKTATDVETKIGTPSNLGGGATISANLSDIEAQTDDIGTAGAGLTNVPWNPSWDAEVQSEVEDALVVHRLDELLNADSDIDGAAPPTVGSVFHELMTKTAGSFTYDQTTDSLEAIRDRGDAVWITATGFSTHSAADVWSVGTRSLTIIDEDSTTLDLDATIRAAVGLAAADLDTQLAALPTAAENADQVWEEPIADHSGTVGSTAEALAAAGSAGDPWGTALPGAYGAGTAGKIVGDNLNATITSRMATYTQPTGFLAATFPAGTVANTTNITAGTITTVTNLTNAPTSGDFTNTMKTSIGTAVAASAVASVTAPVTVGTNNDKTGYRLSATGVDDLHDEVVEGSYTLRQYMRLFAAALLGKASGLETTNAIYRDTGDSVNRIDATVDVDGNRTAVTLDAS